MPPTHADTRWIDRYIMNSPDPLNEIGVDWMDEYWRGTKYPWRGDLDIPEQPLIECLVDGTALIYGTELRMEGYSLVEKLAPDLVGILEKGRLGVDLYARFDGSDEWRLGQIVPTLMTNEERTALVVRHLICMDEKLAGLINKKVPSVGIKPDEINHAALEVFRKDNLKLPDLRLVDVDASWLSSNPILLDQTKQLLTALFLENGGDMETAVRLQA